MGGTFIVGTLHMSPKIKPHEVNADGFVRMLAAGMLNGVGVDRQLVHLAKERGALELARQYLLEERPALG